MHLIFELRDNLRTISAEEVLYLPDILCIGNGADSTHAYARALAYVVIKARTSLLCQQKVSNSCAIRIFFEQTLSTFPLHARSRADRHYFSERLDSLASSVRIGIGTKIARTLLVFLARVFNCWEGVRLGNGNVGIALIVFKIHVEVGTILSNKIALQHQCFVLVFYHNVVKTTHNLHHQRNLGSIILKCNVLPHTSTQVLSFSYIYNLASSIFPEVATWISWYLINLLPNRYQVI